MKNLQKVAITSSMALVILCSTLVQPVGASTCENTIIFARGSGQPLSIPGDKSEAGTFLDMLKEKIGTNSSFKQYQLGSESQEGSKYSAISVDPWQHSDDLFGAWISKGQLNNYGGSVNAGINELASYLKNQHSECPDAQFVLGGYSQGAQVVGQALPLIPRNIRDKIIFAALFGDPKLNLPEGRGLNPPACRKEQYSPYRREVPDCNTDNGVLGARDPYLPEDMKNKVGLWCNDNDLICGSSKIPWVNDGHGKYADVGGAIEKAVDEIVQKINTPSKSQTIFSMFDGIFPKSPDVMLIVDNSTNMAPEYYNSFVKPIASLIAKTTTALGGRIGLETYAGCNPKSGFKNNFTHPTTNSDSVLSKINTTGLYPPTCDTTLDLANTTKHAKEYASWNAKVPHILVVLTSSPFSSYVSTTSMHASPNSMMYLLAPQTAAQTYSGKQINSTNVVPLNSQDFDIILNNPPAPYLRAVIDGPNIDTLPGTELHLSANQTIVENDIIVGYDWDYTGDGVYETTTIEPKITYTYATPFKGLLALRVRTLRGLEQVVTESVNIEYKTPKVVPKAPINLAVKMTSSTTALLQWQPSDALADSWMISIDDMPLGRVAGSQNYINVSDIREDEKKLVFTVKAVTKEWEYGEPASVTLVNSGDISTPKSSSLTSLYIDPVKKELARLGKILGISTLGPKLKPATESVATPYAPGVSTTPPVASNNFIFIIGVLLALAFVCIVVTIILRKISKKL